MGITPTGLSVVNAVIDSPLINYGCSVPENMLKYAKVSSLESYNPRKHMVAYSIATSPSNSEKRAARQTENSGIAGPPIVTVLNCVSGKTLTKDIKVLGVIRLEAPYDAQGPRTKTISLEVSGLTQVYNTSQQKILAGQKVFVHIPSKASAYSMLCLRNDIYGNDVGLVTGVTLPLTPANVAMDIAAQKAEDASLSDDDAKMLVRERVLGKAMSVINQGEKGDILLNPFVY